MRRRDIRLFSHILQDGRRVGLYPARVWPHIGLQSHPAFLAPRGNRDRDRRRAHQHQHARGIGAIGHQLRERGHQADLARRGYKVLVATPYGPEWYPYLMRRLGERPANLLFFLKNTLRG